MKKTNDAVGCEPAGQIKFLRGWFEFLTADFEAAVAELEKLKECPKTVARLVSRASWPLGCASRSLADVADFLKDWSDTKEGTRQQAVCEALQKEDPALVVAQIDASIEILRKAFDEARLRAASIERP